MRARKRPRNTPAAWATTEIQSVRQAALRNNRLGSSKRKCQTRSHRNMESSLNKDKVSGGEGIRPCECPQRADECPLDTLALTNQECVFSNVHGATVNQADCFVGESPLLNKGAIGSP